MKKIFLCLILICLILTGCGKKDEKTVLKEFGDKVNKTNSYYLCDENTTYNFLPRMNIIQITYIDGDNKLILKVILNSKKVSIDLTCDGLEKNIYISDYTNKKDKNYKTFKKYYDKFLSKYFRDFLVV